MDLVMDELIQSESRRYIPEEYFDLKTRIHDRLLDMVGLTVVENLDEQTQIKIQELQILEQSFQQLLIQKLIY